RLLSVRDLTCSFFCKILSPEASFPLLLFTSSFLSLMPIGGPVLILSRFFWSRRTEGRVHRVVPDRKDDVPTSQTGVPGVDLCAEERNGRWQILEHRSSNQAAAGSSV